jgi:hypothetical protein
LVIVLGCEMPSGFVGPDCLKLGNPVHPDAAIQLKAATLTTKALFVCTTPSPEGVKGFPDSVDG